MRGEQAPRLIWRAAMSWHRQVSSGLDSEKNGQRRTSFRPGFQEPPIRLVFSAFERIAAPGCPRWTGKSYRKSSCTAEAHELRAPEDRGPSTSNVGVFVVTADWIENLAIVGPTAHLRTPRFRKMFRIGAFFAGRWAASRFQLFLPGPMCPAGHHRTPCSTKSTSNVRWLQRCSDSPISGDRASSMRPR